MRVWSVGHFHRHRTLSVVEYGVGAILRRRMSLVRLWKSVPLKLPQGSTLSVKSSIPVHVRVRPQWRDDGFLRLRQVFPRLDDDDHTHKREVKLTIDEGSTSVTSLGRESPVVKVSLDWTTATTTNHPTTTTTNNNNDHTFPHQQHHPHRTLLSSSVSDAYGFANVREGCDFRPVPEEEDDDDGNEDELGVTLEVEVPEKCNIHCHITSSSDATSDGPNQRDPPTTKSSIVLESKLEGDADLFVDEGDIWIPHTLRGYQLKLGTNLGMLGCGKLEAKVIELTVTEHGRVRCRMLNGTDIKVTVPLPHSSSNHQRLNDDDDDTGALVDVGSVYTTQHGEGCVVRVTPSSSEQETNATTATDMEDSTTNHVSHVRIKSHHGHVTASTTFVESSSSLSLSSTPPLIDLGGVNGTFDVHVHPFPIPPSTQPTSTSTSTATSVRVHVDSLAVNSSNAIVAEQGHVALTVDRKVDVDLRLLCTCTSPGASNLNDVMDTLLDDPGDDPSHIPTRLESLLLSPTDTTTTSTTTTTPTEVGSMDVQTDHYTSTFTTTSTSPVYTYQQGTLTNQSQEPDSRFDQAVGKIHVASAATQALRSFSKDTTTSQSQRTYDWPLVAIVSAGAGRIQVETLSWFGAIARRYGLGTDDTPRDRDQLGRQARHSVKE